MAGFSGIILGVLPVGDQARKGGNKRTHTADIHANQQALVVIRKLGQQDRRGHIADDLAGKGAKEQGVLFKQGRKQLPYPLYPGHIACKNEKEHEGKKQWIVHFFKRIPVCKHKDHRDDQKADPVRNATENNGNGQSK